MHSAANNPTITGEIFKQLVELGANSTLIDGYGCNILMLYSLVA
jgi:hypothetical protein